MKQDWYIVIKHRNHEVRRDTKTIYKRNPVSGHEWGETIPLRRFVVSRIDGDYSTNPVSFWRNTFKSIDAAKKAIDEAIEHEKVLCEVNQLKPGHWIIKRSQENPHAL